MNEIIDLLTVIFGDGMIAVGIFILTAYIFYFSIVRIFRIYFKERRNPNAEDVKKIQKNASVIIIMMMGLIISIRVLNYVLKLVNFTGERDILLYKGGIILFFVIPLVTKASYGKDFA